jgi:hypothetical protein
MTPINKTLTALQTSTGPAQSDLIRQIESSPGDYAPPVLYMLAQKSSIRMAMSTMPSSGSQQANCAVLMTPRGARINLQHRF